MRQNRELKAGGDQGPSWKAMSVPLVAVGVFGAGTAAAFAFGLGWGWALGGVVLTACSLFLMAGASTERPMPRGAIPVRCELELASAEGDAIPIRVVAVVRVALDDGGVRATELYGGRTLDAVTAAATAMFEAVVRAELGGKPRAELTQPTLVDPAAPPSSFQATFTRMALVVDSLWVGPA